MFEYNQLGVNHLGPFLLTKLLLPLLQAAAGRGETARVVNVTSGANTLAPSHGISLHDLGAEVDYDPLARHGESKLANILHANEITRRYGAEGGGGVVGVAVHHADPEPTHRTGSTIAGMGRKALHFLAHPTGHGDAHHSDHCAVRPHARPPPFTHATPHKLRCTIPQPRPARSIRTDHPLPSSATLTCGRGRAQGASMALLAALQSDGGHAQQAREGGGGLPVHDRAHDVGLARRLWEMSETAVAAVVAAVADTADATIGVGLTPPPAASPLSPTASGHRLHHSHHHAPAAAGAPSADPAGARVG
jgi:hypothetical protein